MLRQGIEPPKARDAVTKKEQGRTFAQLNERYLGEHKASWRDPDKAESLWSNSLRDHAYKIIGDKDVKDIDIKDVHAILSPIWLAKHPTAKKIRWRIGAVLAYAAALDLRADVDLTRSGGKLDKLLPKASRVHVVEAHDSMPYSELTVFLTEPRTGVWSWKTFTPSCRATTISLRRAVSLGPLPASTRVFLQSALIRTAIHC